MSYLSNGLARLESAHGVVPAGYLEVDKPPRTTAVREVREETNMSASQADLSLFDTQFVTHPDGTIVIVVLYCVSYSDTSGVVVSGDDAATSTFLSQAGIESDEFRIESGYQSIASKSIDEFK